MSSAVGAIELAAGLEAVVAVEGAVGVVVMPLAGLFRLGAVGATEALCANATEAVAARMVSDLSKVVGLMVAAILFRHTATRQAPCINKRATFLLV